MYLFSIVWTFLILLLSFFVKLSLLIVIVIFISQLLRMFLPYMFFTPEYYVKKLKFEEQKDQIDLVFLGTSRTNYGINPSIFEQVLANKSTQKLRTYNLGMAGSSIGEIVALSKQLSVSYTHLRAHETS